MARGYAPGETAVRMRMPYQAHLLIVLHAMLHQQPLLDGCRDWQP